MCTHLHDVAEEEAPPQQPGFTSTSRNYQNESDNQYHTDPDPNTKSPGPSLPPIVFNGGSSVSVSWAAREICGPNSSSSSLLAGLGPEGEAAELARLQSTEEIRSIVDTADRATT